MDEQKTLKKCVRTVLSSGQEQQEQQQQSLRHLSFSFGLVFYLHTFLLVLNPTWQRSRRELTGSIHKDFLKK